MFGKVTASLLVLGALIAAPVAFAQPQNPTPSDGAGMTAQVKSPIFGSALVATTAAGENKSVVGKGYYADYYGSYGIQYANYAANAGYYGDYHSAESWAYASYQNFADARWYLDNGY